MLVNFAVKNLFSFKGSQNISMVAASNKADEGYGANTFESVLNGERLLKSSLLFGANASGKSNLIKSMGLIKELVLGSVQSIESSVSQKVIPYLLDSETFNMPSEMEVVFIVDDIKYRYGISVGSGKVLEEWLFFTPSSRETSLFEREGQSVVINKTSFSEASMFVKHKQIEKTREDVPFVSVLAGFDGEHSTRVVDWFKKLHVLSGINDLRFKKFTMELLRKDVEFKEWLLDILKSFQISDINIVESQPELPFDSFQVKDDEVKVFVDSLKGLAKNIKNSDIVVTKRVGDISAEFPMSFESEGTKKLIHMLGPIYDSMKNGNVLIIDEFDSKFHTLLTKHLFNIFHHESNLNSQIVAAVQDVNLMDPAFFRRDQIWFVDKSIEGESELYSLVEYKEKSRALKRNYGEAYLKGAYGAIPLFGDFDQVESIMGNGDGE